MQKDFFNGKKVLLTGHTGFKGTWMTLLLEELGAVVTGFSLPLENNSFFRDVKAKVNYHIEGDIRDAENLYKVIESFKPEIILHFASHSSLDKSEEIPSYILETNIMGVVNLLESARKVKSVKSIVVVTSDKCYRNMEQSEAYVETNALWAQNPYSVSKVCQEIISECYQKTFFEKECNDCIGIATARASNVIAYGDYNLTRLIPYTLDCFLNQKVAHIRNPEAIRPWQYVLDVLWGYLLLSEKLYENSTKTIKYNGPYNFGPEPDGFAEVQKVINILSGCFEETSYEYTKNSNNETKILKLDSQKARSVLDWKPRYSLQKILEETADCAVRRKNGESIDRICRNIVKTYINEVQKNV